MASTILYKFRSGTTFEALPLPGSAARLFDVKKAIVTAKKLDAGSMDFDLSVRNATTNEEYTDEAMLLPRGTRLIVQRLPAAKGHGFLARMARNQYGIPSGPGGAAGGSMGHGSAGAPSGFYEIDSRARDEDDEEFVTDSVDDEDKELAALKAVTETATSGAVAGVRPSTAGFGRSGPAGQGPPQHHHPPGGQGPPRQMKQRQNADPELRDQEKKLLPKKRATGIPRTFLNLSAPTTTEAKEGEAEGESNTPLLQPNTLGFEELKSRGGGQSENAAGTKKSLDYALKVTATTIPDYLQCAICHSVALTAMFLTWDPEGRTTCDKCIRDALTQNGFRDPLTGQEGISPDDLRPNPGIRKAAEAFVKEVMDKIEEIEKHQVEEETTEIEGDGAKAGNLLEGDSGEKGVVVTRRNSMTKRKAKEEDDPFGGDDVFGGDVFAVTADEKPADDEEVNAADTTSKDAGGTADVQVSLSEQPATSSPPKAEPNTESINNEVTETSTSSPIKESSKADSPQVDRLELESNSSFDRKNESSPPPSRSNSDRQQKNESRRENNRQHLSRRGPPAGYQMGPAGGATGPHGSAETTSSRDRSASDDFSQGGNSAGGRSRGGYRGRGRGNRGGRGRGVRFFGRNQQQQGRDSWENDRRSRSPSRDDYSNHGGDDEGRSNKRFRREREDSRAEREWNDNRNGGSGGYHNQYQQRGGQFDYQPNSQGYSRGAGQYSRGRGSGQYPHGHSRGGSQHDYERHSGGNHQSQHDYGRGSNYGSWGGRGGAHRGGRGGWDNFRGRRGRGRF